MALVSLASVKGSPGATTLALLTAALWPRTAFLVDADIRGGDISYRMPLDAGGPVDPDRGLLSLLPLARKEISPDAVGEHAQTILGGTEFIAGLSEPEQAQAVQQLWPALGQAFTRLTSHDVIADLGSVWSGAPHFPLLRESAALVLVLRPRPSDVLHLRRRILRLQAASPASGPAIGVVVVAPARDSADARSAYAALGEDVLRTTEFLGHLALDPKGVGMFEGSVINRPERAELVRSGMPIVEAIARTAGIRIDRQQMIDAGAIPASPRRTGRKNRSAKRGEERQAAPVDPAPTPDRGPSTPQAPQGAAAPPQSPPDPAHGVPARPSAPPPGPHPTRRERRDRA